MIRQLDDGNARLLVIAEQAAEIVQRVVLDGEALSDADKELLRMQWSMTRDTLAGIRQKLQARRDQVAPYLR